MKTILLTGGTGYLGSYILNNLISDDSYNFICLKRSTSSLHLIEKKNQKNILFLNIEDKSWEKIASSHHIDIVFHLATNYGRDNVNFKSVLDSNFYFPLQVLQFSLKYKIPYFINTDTALQKFTNSYSLSKKQLLDWLFFHKSRIKVINLVLESTYGLDDGQFISYLIREILNNKEEINMTRGTQRRDFIHVSDVLSAINIILKNITTITSDFNEFGIGSGINYSIKNLALKIKKITDNNATKINFGAIPFRDHEVMDSMAQISNLCSLGWEPIIDIEKGLKMTINLIKENKL